MKRFIFLGIITSILLTGCINPRVIVHVDKVLPAKSADQVIVFENVDSLPVMCDTVGCLRVKDSGFTLPSRGTYPYVISLAKRKTAECGANTLCVDEHYVPRGSTTYCIRATMLSLPNPQESPFTAWALQQTNINRDAAMVGRVLEDLSHGFRPSNVFKVSAGPALIYSDIYTPTGVQKSTFATNLMADYEHIWKRGYGLGMHVARAWASVDNEKLNLTYVGPSFAAAFREVHKWGLEAALGMGYAYYNDGYHSGHGMGFMFKIGTEYLFTRHIGVGAEINLLSTTFQKPDDVVLPKNKGYGYNQINLLFGPRIYF